MDAVKHPFISSHEPWAPPRPIVSVALAGTILALGFVTSQWLPGDLQALVMFLSFVLLVVGDNHTRRQAASDRKLKAAPELGVPRWQYVAALLPGLTVITVDALAGLRMENGVWMGIVFATGFLLVDAITRRYWNRWYELHRRAA